MENNTTESEEYPRIEIKLVADLEEQDFLRYSYAREKAMDALNHRREKSWKIFSWVSNILIATIGGTVLIASNDKSGFSFDFIPQGILLSIAITILSTYSMLWIHQNLKLAGKASQIINFYNEELGVDDGYEEPKIGFGYVYTIMLLTIAAVLVIVFATFPECTPKPES
ncbi:MAG: hypothetical protein AAGA77_16800 [Bacteroidota bacterium]